MKMSKKGLKELAAVLTEKHGLTSQDAEKFTKGMFEVLNDGLHNEKIVKLKGFGTFKITTVSARKSIDVNTGNPIEIGEREKINFIPDTTMKDLINRPFSQFETVVLNDGVEFPDLNDKDFSDNDLDMENANSAQAATVTMNSIEDETEKKKTNDVEEQEKPLERKNIENSVGSDTENTEEHTDAPSIIEKQTKNKDVLNETILPLVDFSSEDDDTETVSENEDIKEPLEKLPNDPIESADKVLLEANEELREKLKSFKKHVSILGVISFLLLIACCIGVFYVSYQFSIRDNRIQHLEAQVKTRDSAVRPKLNPSKKQNETELLQGPNEINKKTSNSKPEKENINTQEKIKSTAPKSFDKIKTKETLLEGKYNNDARVRTGAYNIIGIDQTVTVKKGQTLNSISKLYLGPGMECYVQAVNGGVTEFKENQKIKIPKLKIKKK